MVMSFSRRQVRGRWVAVAGRKGELTAQGVNCESAGHGTVLPAAARDGFWYRRRMLHIIVSYYVCGLAIRSV